MSEILTAASGAQAQASHHPDESPSRTGLPPERLIQNWKLVRERLLAYLDALGIEPSERDALALQAIERASSRATWGPGCDAFVETFRALEEVLLERHPGSRGHAGASLDDFGSWRLDAALSGKFATSDGSQPGDGGWADGSFPPAMPKLSRRSMIPAWVERSLLRRIFGRARPKPAPGTVGAPKETLSRRPPREIRRQLPWTRAAFRRRMLLIFLVLIPSVVASGFMQEVLPHQGRTVMEVVIVLVFGALFGWISIGFWTATLGFFTLVRRRDRFSITRLDGIQPDIGEPVGRTALVMPICEEPVERVFAGLRAIDDSLRRADATQYFDVFILSDTADPGLAVKEEEAWARWCRATNGFGRIFYRRRRIRLKRKNGNVADFCRRWGRQYRYMVMLDADSIMSGETLKRLAHLMDQHPDVGIIQTAPTAVNHSSLFARVQQFAGRVYGPMFAAGLHFWQLGDGQYWGHNAIIRVEAFTDHCGLAPLPGKPPLGGDILSHDFVEAALLGRAGWTVWLAHDLPGSYEETASSLLDEMQRDRRWCQGNLQHLRLLFTEGFFSAHRALFLNGALSYMSAALWLIFLALSTAEAILNAIRPPDYFPSGPSLFPEWPIWRPQWALALMGVTGMILFLPKLLSVGLIVFKTRTSKQYGGFIRLTFSVFLEILLSSLFAPIRMLFHSRFVLQNLLGSTVTWRSPQREDNETRWRDAIRQHGLGTLLATVWGISLYMLNPRYFWWVTPIIGALILSIPLSVLASRVRLGKRARHWKLFLTPEESSPPQELLDLRRHQARLRKIAASEPPAERDGFVRAIVDPYVNALHLALLRTPRKLKKAMHDARRALLRRALEDGPEGLARAERKVLLSDPELVAELHHDVWQLPDPLQAALWGRPGGNSTAEPAPPRP